MTGEVNRVPEGLLSILDMKARGQSPRQLADQLQVTVDGFELYALGQRERISGATAAITAVGQFGDNSGATLVPPGELWYCWGLSVVPNAALVGAGALRYVAGVLGVTGFPFFTAQAAMDFQASAGDFPIAWGNRPFWMRAGESIATVITEFTAFAPNPTLNLNLIATRYRV